MNASMDQKLTLIFDLDGTLVDTAEDLAASLNAALQDAGMASVDPSAVRSLVGFGARRMLRRGYELSAGRDADATEIERGLTVFLDHYSDNIAVHSRPFDGALAMIERARKGGAAAAICTNKREALARKLLETLGIADIFDTIVGADTAVAAKPDPAPVLLCTERTGAERAVFFGDSDTDIKAAKAAGIPSMIARFGYGPVSDTESVHACFDTYEEAAQILVRDF
ncbi:MAG: HAD-IA family hydrolase [Pseudomonadota bacterium]